MTKTCRLLSAEVNSFHCMFWHFRSHWKCQVLSPVMGPCQISVHYSKDQMKYKATIISAHLSRLISKSSISISRTLSLFIFNSSAISCTLKSWTWEQQREHSVHIYICSLCIWLPTSCIIKYIFSPSLEQQVACNNIEFFCNLFTISLF